MIKKILRVIAEKGSTTSFELELGSSPCINSIGNGKNNVSQLIEYFNEDHVVAVTYRDEQELGDEKIKYEDLKKDIIEEIYDVIMDYKEMED